MLRPAEHSASFFDSEPFLAALADAVHPGRHGHAEEVEVGGLVYRLLRVGRRWITSPPFLDLHRAIGTRADRAPVARLRQLPRAMLGLVSVEGWQAAERPDVLQPAPLVWWPAFDGWEAFERHVKDRKSNWARDTRRRRRKLEREVGAVEFRYHDPSPELIDLCMLWKSRQYRRTGVPDHFAAPRNVDLFLELARRRLLTVSVLNAGGRPAAIHLGAVWNGQFHYWVPAYDPGLQKYSPGRLLLVDLLAASRAEGHVLFDFLLGDEPYKYLYSTHVQIVGRAGPAAFRERVLAPVVARLKEEVRRLPGAPEAMRTTRHFLVTQGVV